MRRMILPLALLAAAPAAAAVPARDLSDAGLYVRARLAEAAGDARGASADLAVLLARTPGDATIAQRAYRQAISANDMALALRTARLLDQTGALPADGRLLLAVEAIRTRNAVAARAAADGLEKDRLFAFFAPYIRAWAAQSARQGDPLAIVEPARTLTVARAYFPEQRALLLLAQGKPRDAAAGIGPQDDALSGPTRLRLADALAGAGARDEALALLEGADPAFSRARATLAGGGRLPRVDDMAGTGVSLLLTRVATDFARQRVVPVALMLARLATYAAPDNAAGWLVSAELLAGLKRSDAALDALGRIDPRDPTAAIAPSLRIAVLTTSGRAEEALKEAQAAAGRDPSPLAWGRVGDVEMMREQPRAAADAYRQAIAAADAAKAPAALIWPLLLQWGAALDQAGDWPGARAAMARAYALAPDEPAVLNQFGYSQIARRENVAEASRLIEQASAARPDDAAITDSLGWANFLRGRPAEAVPLLEKAAEGDPSQSEISEHLGDAYWTVGRRIEARFAWRAALVTAEDKDKARLTSKLENGLSSTTAAP
jgi:tetratricopeptide (TPR) repeat protein